MFARARLVLLLAFALTFWPRTSVAQWQIDGAAVCVATGDQSEPTIASDGAGGTIVAWVDGRTGFAHIYAQHVLASGAVDPVWPIDGSPLCTAPVGQFSPEIVSDGAGGAIVTWQDMRNYGVTLRDIYAQHVLASGAVDPAWPSDGRALCTAVGEQYPPRIVPDGAGGAIVTWEDYRAIPSHIYAQHVLASGAVDPVWPVDGRALCTAPIGQGGPKIVSDGVGGAIVTWEDYRDQGTIGAHTYAQHVLASGAVDPAWPPDGRALNNAFGAEYSPTIVSDGTGGAIVAWWGYRGDTGADIYAQHVLASGAVDPAWPSDGRALCTAVGEQGEPAIVSDDAGGAIVTWRDDRSVAATGSDIYAQHVLGSGPVDSAWPSDGRALCTAIGGQGEMTIVSDAAGGAIVTWRDYRSVGATGTDIYAQRVLASGAVDPAWPSDGRALCTAAGDQYPPRMVSNGAGHAIVTWEDHRNQSTTDYDIYAQKILAGGDVADVITERIEGFVLYAPQPSPTRAKVTITLDLPAAQRISVQILDLSGRGVSTLAANQEFGAGTHRIVWDGTDKGGAPLKSGVYLVRVSAGARSVARKLAILR